MPLSIDRAREDIKRGRPWKARDRLESFVSQQPPSQEALELLGDVLFEMGDLPRAACYWMLTARADERADVAFAALRETYPRPHHLLSALPIRPPLAEYPEAARVRIDSLTREAAGEGITWAPRPLRPNLPVPTSPTRSWWGGPLIIGCLVLLIAALVVGSLGLLGFATDAIGDLLGR